MFEFSTILIVVGTIVAVCALLGSLFFGIDDRAPVLGFFAGLLVGCQLGGFIGFWMVVAHFVAKFW